MSNLSAAALLPDHDVKLAVRGQRRGKGDLQAVGRTDGSVGSRTHGQSADERVALIEHLNTGSGQTAGSQLDGLGSANVLEHNGDGASSSKTRNGSNV